MTTWCLEAYSTDRRSDDVRYRAYTSSRARMERFKAIPKIQFTDSGHGIIFMAFEVRPGEKRQRDVVELKSYVREHGGD